MSLTRKISLIADQTHFDEFDLLPEERAAAKFFDDNERAILGGIYNRVRNAGIWQAEQFREVTLEIWSETKQISLGKADELDLERQPKAWLLKIADNLILRRRSRDLHIRAHEVPVLDAKSHQQNPNEIEIFDQLTTAFKELDGQVEKTKRFRWQAWQAEESPQVVDEIINREEVKQLLAPLKPADRRVIILAVIYELNGEELGEKLNITASAARKQVSRALRRLRESWSAEKALRND